MHVDIVDFASVYVKRYCNMSIIRRRPFIRCASPFYYYYFLFIVIIIFIIIVVSFKIGKTKSLFDRYLPRRSRLRRQALRERRPLM